MTTDSNTFYNSSTNPKAELNNKQKHEQTWNPFRLVQEEKDSVNSKFIENGTKVLKLITIIVVFIAVLGGAVTSKITLFLMISQIGKNVERPYCPKSYGSNEEFIFTVPQVERVTWIWLIIFTYFIPELGTFLRCLRILICKKYKYPKLFDFFSTLFTECFTAIGSALLVFAILPELDILKGAMLTNAMCLIPSLVCLLKNLKRMNKRKWIVYFQDILAAIGQFSACFMWSLADKENTVLWLIPGASVLISVGWWQNFIDQSPINFLRKYGKPTSSLANEKYFTYAILAPLKCLVFFITAISIFSIKESNVEFIFTDFNTAFSDHLMEIVQVNDTGTSPAIISSSISNQMWIWFVNIAASYVCYIFAKFACKIRLQEVNFALPACLSMPLVIIILSALSVEFTRTPCVYSNSVPENVSYLFFNIPSQFNLNSFFNQQYAWIWFVWLFSQYWITRHIWLNKNTNLLSTDDLFLRPMYDAFLIDQSIALNGKRQPAREPITEKIHYPEEIPTVFACGTMWHENKNEMLKFLKSILRMDRDQAIGKKRYNWETHIFFDDAFEEHRNSVNSFVLSLISAVNEAVSKVYQNKENVDSPLIYPTPYGGRLVWTLPGKTPLTVHLKDKKKIKTKKRWSQVMYMYYLIGFKLVNAANSNPKRLETISKNTFILVLDGDIVFYPKSVHMLLEYMKKNRDLGATCGRTHPVGIGALAWYQIFEYAVGHWMQKAIEATAGSILCAPGCFSMYRTYVLLDDNVVARYSSNPTKAAEYLQYDQGEDRWLCTLLLLRGHKVSYCAAADAYTQCPEGFTELYNQRKRWLPSGVVNMFDLLVNSKRIIQVNDSISTPYIYYQAFLMICSVIGPGTIFLMLVSGLVITFEMPLFWAVLLNLIPVVIFVLTCIFCKSDIQLIVAAIISGGYGIVMMMTVVGMFFQLQMFGILAPTTLFIFIMICKYTSPNINLPLRTMSFFMPIKFLEINYGIFRNVQYIIAAIIHPNEFYCLKHGLFYFMAVPSMYLLLIIYTVFNMDDVKWGTREVADEQNDNEITTNLENKKWYENNTNLFAKNVLHLDEKEETFWKEVLVQYLQPFEEDKSKMKEDLRELRKTTVISFFAVNILLVTFMLTLHVQPYYMDWPLGLQYNFKYSDRIVFHEIELETVAQQVEPIALILLGCFVISLIIQFTGMLVHQFRTFALIIANTTLFKFWRKPKYSKVTQHMDNGGYVCDSEISM